MQDLSSVDRELGEIKTHLEYLREGMDEIKGFLKDCPAHRQAFTDHLDNHKKVNRRNLAIISAVASLFAVILDKLFSFVTGSK